MSLGIYLYPLTCEPCDFLNHLKINLKHLNEEIRCAYNSEPDES